MLDFSTNKNELFPVVASVFSKTSSLGIKVRGLEAFLVLCGGSTDHADETDGLNGLLPEKQKSPSSALDKFTIQEKIVPLIRAIRTKEPAVAMAALKVLRHAGGVADAEYTALHILPILWNMSLGPLLSLEQFQAFMEIVKSLSGRVENEQSKKLQELSAGNGHLNGTNDFHAFGNVTARPTSHHDADNPEVDFERLVKGSKTNGNSTDDPGDLMSNEISSNNRNPSTQIPPSFSWSAASTTTSQAARPVGSPAIGMAASATVATSHLQEVMQH